MGGEVGAANCYCDQQFHGSERYSADQLLHTVTNCYLGVTGTVRLTHQSQVHLTVTEERYSAANCYMGGRGTVRPTVTWEGEVQCGQLLHGRRGALTVRPTVTWEGEVQCGQLLHGR